MMDNPRPIVDRLLEFLNTETSGLTRDPQFDLARSNLLKTQLLLELNRTLRMSPVEENVLKDLKDALVNNAREIEVQLTAVREITNVVFDTLRFEREDGTYTQLPNGAVHR